MALAMLTACAIMIKKFRDDRRERRADREKFFKRIDAVFEKTENKRREDFRTLLKIIREEGQTLRNGLKDLAKQVADLRTRMSEQFHRADEKRREDFRTLLKIIREEVQTLRNGLNDLAKQVADLSARTNEQFADRTAKTNEQFADLSARTNEQFADRTTKTSEQFDRADEKRREDFLALLRIVQEQGAAIEKRFNGLTDQTRHFERMTGKRSDRMNEAVEKLREEQHRVATQVAKLSGIVHRATGTTLPEYVAAQAVPDEDRSE